MMAALAVTSVIALAHGASAQTTKPAPITPIKAPTKPGTPAPTPRGELTPQSGTLTPQGRMIRAYVGQINPFWGDTTAYWGNTDPLGTDLTPFWGKLQPYGRMIRAYEGQITEMGRMIRAYDGDLSAMGRMIRAYWGEVGATGRMIRAYDSAGALGYAGAIEGYRTFVSQSEAFWGVPVREATGKSFADAFAKPMLAKYGIDLNNPNSLASLSPDRREMFFLDWQDQLMQYSGADQVDHWMKPIGWTPALTQQQGSGSRAIVGMIDFFDKTDPDIAAKVIYSGGYTVDTGHGAGVASLLLASHDGKGVMGIAPNARVAAYNPFDASYSADWSDIIKGIPLVGAAGASVINLSLGVPGWTLHSEWRNVFATSAVKDLKDKTIFVIAAGNSGTVQTQNVNMKDAFDSTFLVVGSVAPDNTISSFSNQPGWVCLTDGAECKNTQRAGVGKTGDRFVKSDYLKESGYLMNRFLVAPGELLLVADGEGGVTRMSGTSFSAPLVAGAIALIHDRWPWLKKYPRDVAKILLDSATDLGEKGADPVYGRGMLNIERAQSVLDFDKLSYELWNGTNKSGIKVDALRAGGMKTIWETSGMYFAAFEKLDSGERDFLIPLSSRLFGQQRNGLYFQEFVYNHFVNWMATGVGFAGKPGQRLGFSDVSETPLTGAPDSWSFSMSGRMTREQFADFGMGRASLRSAVTLHSPSKAFSFSFGSGDGAVNLGGRNGLLSSDDFDPYNGGVNPLLGFASGGAHMGTTLALGSGVSVSVGATEQRQSLNRRMDGSLSFEDRVLIGQTGRYGASAQDVRVDYRPASWLGLSASVTRLAEDEAFLGTRSLANSDFGRGTTTNGVTLQSDVSITDDLVMFGSATMARSTSADRDAAFRLADGGAVGSAFQIGFAKTRLLGQNDRVRFAVSQPLTMERGTAEFTSIMVIDRETGEKGPVTQTFDITGSQPRRLIGEASYGTMLMGGRGEISLFGRGEFRRTDANVPQLMAGGRASLVF
jgi:hypothetical protein